MFGMCLYEIGEPKSFVFGSIIDGVFDGKIHSEDGVYYVERAHKYFGGDATNGTEPFHSVIYKEAHVVDPYEDQRTGIPPTDPFRHSDKSDVTFLPIQPNLY